MTRPPRLPVQDRQKTTLLIAGIRVNRCWQQLVESLEAVPGTRCVHVSSLRGLAVIEHTFACSPQDLLRAAQRLALPAEIFESVGIRRYGAMAHSAP